MQRAARVELGQVIYPSGSAGHSLVVAAWPAGLGVAAWLRRGVAASRRAACGWSKRRGWKDRDWIESTLTDARRWPGPRAVSRQPRRQARPILCRSLNVS